MPTALDYARELVACDSVSSKSNVEVTERVQEWLRGLGFDCERVDFTDECGVAKANVVGKLGSGRGGLAYFGHTDVVPAMDWKFTQHGPFDPVVREGRLYGRGSTDMKGSIACMLAAVASLQVRPARAPIFVCCTADEEVGMFGAQQVAQRSQLYREIVEAETRSIVGEPTQFDVVHGHKGGCVVIVTAHGVAAHSSTNDGVNANWQMIPFLTEMKALRDELETDPRWRNPEFDPPTMSLNLTINDGLTVTNITAAQSVCALYFRPMPGVPAEPVIERIQRAVQAHGLECRITFRTAPFYVDPWSPFVQECLEFSSSSQPRTVSYGTDAARMGDLKHCVVMGPGDIAQAHTNAESIALSDLEAGTAVYRRLLERWCL